MKTHKITVMLLFVVLFVLLLALGSSASNDKAAAELDLPAVGTVENLKELLKDFNHPPVVYGGDYVYDDMIAFDAPLMMAAPERAEEEMAAATPTAPAAINGGAQGMAKSADTARAAGDEAADFSSTNVQVQGVDEADLDKTDGHYIYKVADDAISIVEAVPADKMKIVAQVKIDEESFTPSELYIDRDRMVVVGNYWEEKPYKPGPRYNKEYYYWVPVAYESGMRIMLYDVSDVAHPRLMRQENIPGNQISTRKVGNYLYFAASQSVDFNALEEGKGYQPKYSEQTFGSLGEKNQQHEINLADVKYFPECIQPEYLMLGAIQIRELSQPMVARAYLADGDALYANQKHMYVALATWYDHTADGKISSSDGTKTHIYRFALNEMKMICDGKGEVPGDILNQFSMDEHNGYFRIATTTGSVWSSGEDTSKNNLYILDSQLKQVGAVTGIAPGETIYSVRFVGDRAYMVTFRTVDPFFVLDLSNPQSPKILGKLKIPGYSDYLHPYDDNHIIGFGKETIELKNGYNDEPNAYYLGMKVALFDVTNVENPVELSKVEIGDRGTDSDLLNDHKALLFDASRNLLAFPVTEYTLPEGRPVVDQDQYWASPNYGDFSFQGAYVYHLTLDKGFDLQGRITHLTDDDYAKAGSWWYNDELNIKRILYIGDQLYTVSDGKIQANRAADLNVTGSVELDMT